MAATDCSSEALALGAILALVLAGLIFASLYSAKSARKAGAVQAQLALKRGERLAESMRLFKMAEQIADLGLWQYYPQDNRHVWSEGMKKLFGVEPDETLLPGDIETLLSPSDINVIDILAQACDEHQQIDMSFPIARFDSELRELSLSACHLSDRSGQTIRVIAVVMDVTDQKRRERRLKESREIALREAQQARELAETDALTGLANRRKVMLELDRLIMMARAKEEPLSLIVFDVDHFKKVNDSFGHQAGDEVLKRLSGIVWSQARAGDIVGRIGGEEFVWILPGAQSDAAHLIADRLRLAVALVSGTACVPPVTVSLGLASLTHEDTSLSLFARADKALYEAKGAGRNLVRQAA